MRPAARWVSVAAVLCASAAPGVLSTAAWADSGVSSVLASNWYWQEQDNVTPAGAPAGLPAGAPSPASGIPDGDLGVGYTNQVDKVTALNFDVTSLPQNGIVTKFAVTMPVDQSAHNLANGTPLVAACPAIDAFKPGDGPSPFSQVPPQGTSVCVDGKYDATTQSYTFDIAQIATDWAGGAPVDGIVVQPKPGDNTPFNYAFAGPKDIKVAVEFASTAAPVAAPVAPPADSGTGAALSPSLTGTTPVAPLTPVQPPALAVAPAPQAMPQTAPAPAPQAAPAAVATVPVDALRPTGLFWLSLLGFALLLLLLGLVLGDPLAPVAHDARRRRFAEVVRARAAARAAATAPTSTRALPA